MTKHMHIIVHITDMEMYIYIYNNIYLFIQHQTYGLGLLIRNMTPRKTAYVLAWDEISHLVMLCIFFMGYN